MLIGLGASIMLALAALRWPRIYEPVASASGLLYTIPSLAVFALVVPFIGIGTPAQRFATAEVALVTYTLLILVRNIVTGIRGVPAETTEAATGMGYRKSEVFRKVEVPMAMPVIFAGIRIATVTVIGLVTVTSLLGLGGLGFFILDGFRRSIIFPTEIIVGVVLSVLLAALVDLALLGLSRTLTPWASRSA